MLFFAVIQTGCKKDNSTPTSPEPNWQVDTTGKYAFSMTAVVIPDSQDSTKKINLNYNDKLAAFINGECRGIGTIRTVDGNIVFLILISGTSSESDQVSFQYYNTQSSVLYSSASSVTPFVVDSYYGTPDVPKYVTFTPLK